MEQKNWIALISQTGGELKEICLQLTIKPRAILTNNVERLSDENLQWFYSQNIIVVPLNNKPTVEEYFDVLRKGEVITLHGFLRILPREVVEEFNIFNGHPGLITAYPDLKGLDPQIRAFIKRYRRVGAVCHKVIAEVDEGEVLTSSEANFIITKNTTSEDYFSVIKECSIKAWKKLLTDEFFTRITRNR